MYSERKLVSKSEVEERMREAVGKDEDIGNMIKRGTKLML